MSGRSESLPYVPLVEYNGSTSTGGNPLTQDLNVFYNAGDIAWMLTSTALVLLMIPGVGLFYSGLARRKSALSLIFLSIASIAVVTFQWFFWGYSLAFSHTATNGYIGNMEAFALRGLLAGPSPASPKIPNLLYAVYEGMFACLTVALLVGAISERGRLLPCIVFMFVWTTLVYDALACWTWNPSGWVYRLGALDFAGGTPVHISSGTAALAFSYVLGKRSGHNTRALSYRPHDVTHIVIGTVFLWVGWFGFNAGSALGANMRAIMAALVTNLSACVSGLTWCILDYRLEGKWSAVGFCSGVISGLVVITPGSGFVPPWASVLYGITAGIGCNYGTQLKFLLGRRRGDGGVDDALDIFAVHGVGGVLGNILTGLFAADYIAALDGRTVIRGGWLSGHWKQVAVQLADSAAGMAYSFFMTLLILMVMGWVGKIFPGLRLRVSLEEEERGIDDVELGEFAYDYVESTRDAPSFQMQQQQSQQPQQQRQTGRDYDDDDDDDNNNNNNNNNLLRSSMRSGDSRVAFGTTGRNHHHHHHHHHRRYSLRRDLSVSPPPPPGEEEEEEEDRRGRDNKVEEFRMTAMQWSSSPGFP